MVGVREATGEYRSGTSESSSYLRTLRCIRYTTSAVGLIRIQDLLLTLEAYCWNNYWQGACSIGRHP